MRGFIIISLLCALGLSSAAAARADELQVQENAPDRYVVVKGDTLWDISGRFLKQPWRWPEIWRLNKEQIKNPHWIYPGDVIVLDRTQHPPRLSIEGRGAPGEGGPQMGTDALQAEDNPRARVGPEVKSSAHVDAIPSIPLRDVQAFMGHPRVIDAAVLDAAPQVVAFDSQRDIGSSGDQMFTRGALPPGVHVFQIYRPGPPLVDPVTHQTLAYRASYVGDARLSEEGPTARFLLLKGAMETSLGDRLLAPEVLTQFNFVPSAPARQVTGHVLGLADGRVMAARHEVVVISRGSADGLQPGNILAVYPTERDVATQARGGMELPETRSGLLFVFRTFDRVSYALIVQSQRPVNVLDSFRNP